MSWPHHPFSQPNLISFFNRKAERLCRLFSLSETDPQKSIYRIERIQMTASKDIKANLNNGNLGSSAEGKFQLTIVFHKKAGKNNNVNYHVVNSQEEIFSGNASAIECFDDKIHVIDKDKKQTKAAPLFAWINKLKDWPSKPDILNKWWEKEIASYKKDSQSPEEKEDCDKYNTPNRAKNINR